MQWSDWHSFSGCGELGKNPAQGIIKMGVYRVRATLPDGKGAKTIRRACGDDTEGILYIGQGCIEARVGSMENIYLPEGKNHHNFSEVFRKYDLERICPHSQLEVQWQECDDCVTMERKLIEEYKMKFGDIPPGNRKMGG